MGKLKHVLNQYDENYMHIMKEMEVVKDTVGTFGQWQTMLRTGLIIQTSVMDPEYKK